jgi:hypothetical protein
MAVRWCLGAVPAKTLSAKTLFANTLVAKTLVVKTLVVKTEINYMVRCCQSRAVSARIHGRQCGCAWAYVYNVLPCGVRVRRDKPPSGGTSRYRAPGSLTGDCPNARERAVRQRIR